MHGDDMKKEIKVNYTSIFKYDDHHETVKFKSDGYYEKVDGKERFVFYNDKQKIEMVIRGNDLTLVNGPAILNLSYHRKIANQYYTEYGMIELFCELVSLENDRNVKLKYILSDGYQQLSEVYVMMNYEFREDSYEEF